MKCLIRTATALLLSSLFLLLCGLCARATTWSDADIGAPTAPGSHSENGSAVTVVGAGTGEVTSGNDQLHFTYTTYTGDVDVIVRLASFTGSTGAHAGIMLRNNNTASTATTCANAVWYQNGTGGLHLVQSLARDVTTNTANASGATTRMTLPIWMRLVRMGNYFAVYKSPNGTIWSMLGNTSGWQYTPTGSIEVGLFVSSGNAGSTASATFDNITIGAPNLGYRTSLFGNSFMGNLHNTHVSSAVQALWVNPDGTCYTNSYWDEDAEASKIYKDGQVITSFRYAGDWHNEPLGNSYCGEGSITSDGTNVFLVAYAGQRIYKTDLLGSSLSVQQMNFTTNLWWSERNVSVVSGMAVVGNELFVSDARQQKILVADKTTLNELPARAFSFTRPGPMTKDNRGDLWIIQEANDFPIGTKVTTQYTAAIKCYHTNGTYAGKQITDVVNPTAIAYDAVNDRLLIADNSVNQDIAIYNNLATTPTFQTSFGVAGGLYAGANPGLVNDPASGGYTRLYGLVGVGIDSSGNIYTALGQQGTDLRKFTPSGSLVWKLNGMVFCNTADVDPDSDGVEVYSPYFHGTMNYAQTAPASEWSLTGVNWDAVTYGTAPRQHNAQAVLQRVGPSRKLILYTCGQGLVEYIAFFRYVGERLVPCGQVRGDGGTVWIDQNGDGLETTNEVSGCPGIGPIKSFCVDANGDLWLACEAPQAQLRRFKFKGLTAQGAPIYSTVAGDYESINFPANTISAVGHRLAVKYDSVRDAMYLVGPAVVRNDQQDCFAYLARYDNWSTGNRTARWSFSLPNPDTNPNFMYEVGRPWGEKHQWMGMDVAVDKVFIADIWGDLLVYNADTGVLERIMNPGPEAAGSVAWEDAAVGVRAFKRSNGEYIVFTENSGFDGKINMFRLAPSGPVNNPPTVSITAPANGATYTAPTTVNITATASDSDGTVTKVEFYQGATKLGEDTTSPYSYNWTNVSAGSYSLTARATDNGGAITTSAAVNITVNAPSNQPPTVSLTAPANGATYTAPATVNMTATASDSDGTVTKVEFYQGVTKLGEDTTSPYSYDWTNVAVGSYSLTAKATDNGGAVTTSTAVNITVNAAAGSFVKGINLNGNAVTIEGNTWLSYSAALGSGLSITGSPGVWGPGGPSFTNADTGASATTDENTMLSTVMYKNNSTFGLNQTIANGTYDIYLWLCENHQTNFRSIDVSLEGTSVATGIGQLQYAKFKKYGPYSCTVADGTLNIGITTHSDGLLCGFAIFSAGGSNQAPTVSITAPANGATYTAPATVNITATASDSDGTISKVEFYQGTTKLGEDTTSPYSYDWTGVTAGSYSLTAKAIDDDSAVTTSTAVNITVNNPNQAPTVSITAPANGATYTAPATVNITATASDSDGTISKVEFYQGTTKLGEDTTSPYSYNWTNVAAGSYSLTAKAIDDDLAVTTSTAVNITVNAAGGGSFVKGVNLNGNAVTIESNTWLSYSAALSSGLSITGSPGLWGPGSMSFSNADTGTAATTDENAMLNTVMYKNGSAFGLNQTITNGAYDVYVWLCENYQTNYRNIDVSLEGTSVATGIGQLQLGKFKKYGPYTCTVADGTLNISITPHGDGLICGFAIFTSGGGGGNQAPTVSLTAPSNGAVFQAPASITMTATASDTDGTVSKVEFYQGTTKLGEDITSPYSYNWTSVAAGSYSLTAKAIDDDSAATTSSAVNVTVNAQPTVSITAPANGATYTAPATVNMTATASDTDGTISKVEFYQGATKLGEDTTSPYSYDWTSVAAGSYSLTAKAYDNNGGITTSTAVNITVNSGGQTVIDLFSGLSVGTVPNNANGWTRDFTTDGSSGNYGQMQYTNTEGSAANPPCMKFLANGSSGHQYGYRDLGTNSGLTYWKVSCDLKYAYVNTGDKRSQFRILVKDSAGNIIANLDRLTWNWADSNYVRINGSNVVLGGTYPDTTAVDALCNSWNLLTIEAISGNIVLHYGSNTVTVAPLAGSTLGNPKTLEIKVGENNYYGEYLFVDNLTFTK